MRKKTKIAQVSPSALPERERDPPHPSLRMRRIEELSTFRNDAEATPTRCPHCHGRDIGHDRHIVIAKWFRCQVDYRYCVPCNAVLHCDSLRAFIRPEDDCEVRLPSPLPAS